MTALLCTLVTAIAFALAHGTPDVWPLAWLAPVPILWLAFGERRAWPVALSAASAYALGELGVLWPYVKPAGAVVVGAAIGPALAFALVVLGARLVFRRTSPLAATFTFAALWTGWTWLASALSPHGTFGAWAYSQVDAPIVIQSASLFGLWVVDFLIAFTAAALASSARPRRAEPIAVALMLVAANLAFGAWHLRQSDGLPVLRVAASARDHDDHATPESVASEQAAEARRLAAQGVTTIVFPEKGALLPDVRRDTALAPLVAVARETGATIATGFDQTGTHRRNVAYVIDGASGVTIYTKRHHIPGLESGYTVGETPGLLGGRRAVAICKDLDFQRTLRSDVASAGAANGGLGVMLAPSWDFGSDGWLHARMAIMRGVEGGYAIVRAASNGLLTVSDAQGRVVARRESGADAYVSVIAEVAMGHGATPYVRLGDAFAWVMGVVGVILVLGSASRPAR